MMSVICSGIVSLFLVNVVEVKSDNRQAERSRLNCESINDDRRDTRDSLDQQADNVLGDETTQDGDPNEDTKPADFNEGVYRSFKEFRPLIIAQAAQNRKRSRQYDERIVNCAETFPKRKTFGFIE